MSASSSNISAFGEFSRLPKELRLMIWKELLPESTPSNVLPKHSLAILRASQQMGSEVATELYSNRVLVFHIAFNSATMEDSSYLTRISKIPVRDQFGSTWCLRPRFHKASDQQSLFYSAWKQLPFHRLKGIRFELIAPDPTDPAQLIQMWNKLCWLMNLLQHVQMFSNVEICILDMATRKWQTNGKLQQSLTNMLPSIMNQDITDLEILLSPFLRLRNTTQIEIKHPFHETYETLNCLISNIISRAVSTKPLGHDINDDNDDIDDELILEDEDTWTVWFDYILDNLSGQNAPFVRLERFWNWSWHYERYMWCLIKSDCELGGAILSELEDSAVKNALSERFRAKLAFNPMSVKHVKENYGKDAWYYDLEDSLESQISSTGKDGWCAGQWWTCYPQGIPRQSSPEYKRLMEKYGDPNVIPLFGVGREWCLIRDW